MLIDPSNRTAHLHQADRDRDRRQFPACRGLRWRNDPTLGPGDREIAWAATPVSREEPDRALPGGHRPWQPGARWRIHAGEAPRRDEDPRHLLAVRDGERLASLSVRRWNLWQRHSLPAPRRTRRDPGRDGTIPPRHDAREVSRTVLGAPCGRRRPLDTGTPQVLPGQHRSPIPLIRPPTGKVEDVDQPARDRDAEVASPRRGVDPRPMPRPSGEPICRAMCSGLESATMSWCKARTVHHR